ASLAGSRADCVRESSGIVGPEPSSGANRVEKVDSTWNVDSAKAAGSGRGLSLTLGPNRRSPIAPSILRLAQERIPTAGEVDWFLELTGGSAARGSTTGAPPARCGNPGNRAARWQTPPGPPTGRSDRDSRSG